MSGDTSSCDWTEPSTQGAIHDLPGPTDRLGHIPRAGARRAGAGAAAPGGPGDRPDGAALARADGGGPTRGTDHGRDAAGATPGHAPGPRGLLGRVHGPRAP